MIVKHETRIRILEGHMKEQKMENSKVEEGESKCDSGCTTQESVEVPTDLAPDEVQ